MSGAVGSRVDWHDTVVGLGVVVAGTCSLSGPGPLGTCPEGVRNWQRRVWWLNNGNLCLHVTDVKWKTAPIFLLWVPIFKGRG